jgi:hypothetical protein
MLATLFFKIPIFSVALKEFMDAAALNKACLRALVQVSRSIDPVYGIGEFAHPLHIEIPKYDTLPIVEALGLHVKWTTVKWDPEIGNVEVDIIEPIRPYWIKMAMSGGDSKNLCLRAGTEPNWHTNECCSKVPPEPPFGEKHRRLPFGPGLFEKLREEWTERPLDIIAEEWLRDLLTKELIRILVILGREELQIQLRSLNLRVSVPDTDESRAAFVSSLSIDELLRVVDWLEEHVPSLASVSYRYTREDLAEAIELIPPQTAFENILNEPWIKHPDQDTAKTADKTPPVYRISRDSAGDYFKTGHTDWTGEKDAGDDLWYWESIENGNQPEPPDGDTNPNGGNSNH